MNITVRWQLVETREIKLETMTADEARAKRKQLLGDGRVAWVELHGPNGRLILA